jgi:hypothetical protein
MEERTVSPGPLSSGLMGANLLLCALRTRLNQKRWLLRKWDKQKMVDIAGCDWG